MLCRCGHAKIAHNFWVSAAKPHAACMASCWCREFSIVAPFAYHRRLNPPPPPRPPDLPIAQRVFHLPGPPPIEYARRLVAPVSIVLAPPLPPPATSTARCPIYYLSICAICRDENAYLPEWLEYHRLVGVDHVFLYDNESATPLAATVAPWIAEGFVTVLPLPGAMNTWVQRRTYNRALVELGPTSVWMAFIDVDEFIFPKAFATVPEILYPLEERWGGVTILWRIFGTSGHQRRPLGQLQVEAFTQCAPIKRPACPWCFKTIVQPARARDNDVHTFAYHAPWDACDGAAQPFRRETADVVRIQVNHYWSRSRAEFRDKLIRSEQAFPKDHDSCMGQLKECEREVDFGLAARWARKLRARLQGLPGSPL